MMRILSFFLLFLLFIGCTYKNPLEKVLSSNSEEISRVMKDPNKYEVQILFTEIERKDSQTVVFKDYEYNVDDNTYFYPASSVKLPAAIFALEKVVEFQDIDRHSQFQIQTDSIETNIADEVRKLLLISDNESYNRLFEFVGKDELNQRLNARGIKGRFTHRLSAPDSDNLISKTIVFKTKDSSLTIPQRTNREIEPLGLRSVIKGKGFIQGDSLVNQPKDFSKKNYMPVRSLHGIIKRLIFPDNFPKGQQFQLSLNDRLALIKTMGLVPRNAKMDPIEYPDNYVKFLVLGDSNPEDLKPKDINIFNKVGYAYGYLIDTAYIVNDTTKKEYIITAVIHVNENQIFNDDRYEYETIGIPFLAELGRQLVNHSGKNKG